MTFLELAELINSDQLASADQFQPSFVARGLGRCRKCKSHTFTLKTEKARHYAAAHRIALGDVTRLEEGRAIPRYRHMCMFKTDGGLRRAFSYKKIAELAQG